MTQKNKEFLSKLATILLTAVISAAIAALQALLTHYINPTAIVPNPEVAGGIGAILRTGYYIIKQPRA